MVDSFRVLRYVLRGVGVLYMVVEVLVWIAGNVGFRCGEDTGWVVMRCFVDTFMW